MLKKIEKNISAQRYREKHIYIKKETKNISMPTVTEKKYTYAYRKIHKSTFMSSERQRRIQLCPKREKYIYTHTVTGNRKHIYV